MCYTCIYCFFCQAHNREEHARTNSRLIYAFIIFLCNKNSHKQGVQGTNQNSKHSLQIQTSTSVTLFQQPCTGKPSSPYRNRTVLLYAFVWQHTKIIHALCFVLPTFPFLSFQAVNIMAHLMLAYKCFIVIKSLVNPKLQDTLCKNPENHCQIRMPALIQEIRKMSDVNTDFRLNRHSC